SRRSMPSRPTEAAPEATRWRIMSTPSRIRTKVLVAAGAVVVLVALAVTTVAVSRSSPDEAAPTTTAPSTIPPEPTDEVLDSTAPSTTDTVSEPAATDDGPALTTENPRAAADGSAPPPLPGPTCDSIPHGDGPWEAIDPSCVK